MRAFIASLFLFIASPAFSAGPFELKWMNSEEGKTTYRSSDHPHAVFVIEAYRLNCHFCHLNAPFLNDLTDDFKDEPRVQIVDIGYDSNDHDYEEWIRQHSPNHPVLKDGMGKKYLKQFQVKGVPSTILVDCKGKEIYRYTGAWQGDSVMTRIKAKISKALADPKCKP